VLHCGISIQPMTGVGRDRTHAVQQKGPLTRYFVGAREHGRRHVEAERLHDQPRIWWAPAPAGRTIHRGVIDVGLVRSSIYVRSTPNSDRKFKALQLCEQQAEPLLGEP